MPILCVSARAMTGPARKPGQNRPRRDLAAALQNHPLRGGAFMTDPVYDLGDVDVRAGLAAAAAQAAAGAPSSKRSGKTARSTRSQVVAAAPSPAAWAREPAASPREGYAVGSTLSLFVPGLGQVIRGRVDQGVLLLTSFGFLTALAWAVWTSQARLAGTLPFLDLSRAWNIRTIMILYGVAALLHVTAVVGCIPRHPGRRPAAGLLALASSIIPGWGQALSGRRWRTALCLGGLWVVGFAWLLASPAMQAALVQNNLVLPQALRED
jgi:TM2 domain-containing membrane protein YozV